MPNYFQTVKPPYFAANFDYFRIPREKWELMLSRLKQLRVNTLTLVTPWGFHEYEKGTIDLQGVTNSRRNLIGLLNLCQKLNFYCILNIGPYHQHQGLLNDGLPTWLAEDSFLKMLQGWYSAISQPSIEYQWPDGPIIALQFNSTGINDNSPAAVDERLTEVKWPIWLRKRYGEIDKLNAAYGTDYNTMSRVIFPTTWSQEPTPFEKDAKLFLDQQQQARETEEQQILVEAGWHIPIYSSKQNSPDTPQIQNWANFDALETVDSTSHILNLQQPIQIDYDPVEIGRYPVWASEAPINADGSLRRQFWILRQRLWQHQNEEAQLDDPLLTIAFDGGGAVISNRDTILKINLPKGSKPTCYRLRSNGEIITDENLRVFRGKLSGQYLVEDEIAQTDLVFYLNAPGESLPDFLDTYLNHLLKAQLQTLIRCVALLTTLSESLSSKSTPEAKVQQSSVSKSSYTLDDARRGLKDADVALRKAVRSIGGLESGFDVILGRTPPEIPQAATSTVSITPDIFDDAVKNILYDVGQVCGQAGSELKAATARLQQTLDPAGLTIEQYQHSYKDAITVADHCRQELDELVAEIRIDIALEKLPLVVWRVHDQIQSISNRLRWGVLRH